MFNDLLAAVLLYLEAWSNPKDVDGVDSAFAILQEEAQGILKFTWKEKERIFRDAAIRAAIQRGEDYADIAWRYGISPSMVSRIAIAAGIRKKSKKEPPSADFSESKEV